MDWDQATDVAGMLVREKGLPWRTAHQIVGILVRLSKERKRAPNQVTSDMLDEASKLYWNKPLHVAEEWLQDALDPVSCVARRTLYGGPAPSEVRTRLSEYETPLQEDIELVYHSRKQVEDGLCSLESDIDSLLETAN